MTNDTPGPTAPRDPPPSCRFRDIQDPLALFPTETEVDATRKAEARVKLARERARKAKATDGARIGRRRRWRAIALVSTLAIAAAAWFAVPNLAGEIGSRVRLALFLPPTTLVVETTPAGWNVMEGGRLLGTTPLHIELPPGFHQLTLRHGATARPLAVTLPAGARVIYHLDLAGTPPTSSGGPGAPLP